MDMRELKHLAEFAGLDLKDIQLTQALLAQYFGRDEQKRFEMEGPLGGGVSGITWKIKYTPPNQGSASAAAPVTQRLALKTEREYTLGGQHDEAVPATYRGSGYINIGSDGSAYGREVERNLPQEVFGDVGFVDVDSDGWERPASSDADDPKVESMLPQEKRYLEFLRWAKHIVHSIPVSDDPLKKVYPGIQSHYMQPDHWIYMEYLQNGTLEKLVDRAARRGAPLPNRLLWRFFLCLVRMCIGLGWPPTQGGADGQPVTETAAGRPHGGLIHGDMHDRNIMFGDFDGPNDADKEHTLAPIMKLIDLGFMRHVLNENYNLQNAVAKNLSDIGEIMLELITRNNNAIDIATDEDARPYDFAPHGPRVLTSGTILLPPRYGGRMPFPLLDPLMRALVCQCLATRRADRPNAAELAATVIDCINTRDEAYYARIGLRGESDDDIRALIQELIFDAD